MCRLWSTELSEIKPQLDDHNITLAGVALEELGLVDFQKGGFFKGDLYIDTEKKTYKDLQFKRYNFLTIVGGLAAQKTRNSLSRANLKGIKGDFKGDGMQNGGLLIVNAGGDKVLFSHQQQSPGDHVSNDVILETLGLASEGKSEGEMGATGGTGN